MTWSMCRKNGCVQPGLSRRTAGVKQPAGDRYRTAFLSPTEGSCRWRYSAARASTSRTSVRIRFSSGRQCCRTGAEDFQALVYARGCEQRRIHGPQRILLHPGARRCRRPYFGNDVPGANGAVPRAHSGDRRHGFGESRPVNRRYRRKPSCATSARTPRRNGCG